ncbi:hypothetical protein BDK51DRAFT_31720 [Blyttiomyces helicus]|uniref:Uncharacterized protein n=1 Tax=Blyttiomyces helicus TaxID=388810 RepID=A0A4P9WSP7_9FUNG|nr:hypothetical protein BDK51DRAFT_31720 [Blyttiomyces helicus]|eukprot:RKO94330.1 hypothetical protein BDK51DRAFT_31720 [Blyttiomyces helicus]
MEGDDADASIFVAMNEHARIGPNQEEANGEDERHKDMIPCRRALGKPVGPCLGDRRNLEGTWLTRFKVPGLAAEDPELAVAQGITCPDFVWGESTDVTAHASCAEIFVKDSGPHLTAAVVAPIDALMALQFERFFILLGQAKEGSVKTAGLVMKEYSNVQETVMGPGADGACKVAVYEARTYTGTSAGHLWVWQSSRLAFEAHTIWVLWRSTKDAFGGILTARPAEISVRAETSNGVGGGNSGLRNGNNGCVGHILELMGRKGNHVEAAIVDGSLEDAHAHEGGDGEGVLIKKDVKNMTVTDLAKERLGQQYIVEGRSCGAVSNLYRADLESSHRGTTTEDNLTWARQLTAIADKLARPAHVKGGPGIHNLGVRFEKRQGGESKADVKDALLIASRAV